MYQYILFDLDGTLTESGEGIINSAKYALAKMGIGDYDETCLLRFIGPPLQESFRTLIGLSEQDTDLAIKYYREYYQEKGWCENRVYDGIEDLLKQLKDMQKTLIVATSKPEDMARKILQYFHLDSYFTYIAGASNGPERIKKEDVIRYALSVCKISNLSSAVMVGDRSQDVNGAKAVGLDCIGVLYGYGGREELKQAGAKNIAVPVQDVFNYV